MPDYKSQTLRVTKITSTSITIAWERWAGCTINPDPITYKVRLKAGGESTYRIVKEGKGLYTHTITGLNPGTDHYVSVRAFDESGQVCQYPIANGSLKVTTLAADKVAPVASNRKLTIVRVTSRTAAIKWEPATDNMTEAKDIRYRVRICEGNNPNEHWRTDIEAKNITSHTFKGLKPNTNYGIYVLALDEAGNTLRYPSNNSVACVDTKRPDTQPPTAEKDCIYIREANEKITIHWNPATDNETSPYDMRYEVYIKEVENPADPWHTYVLKGNYSTYTFKGLKDKTRYGFFLKAIDESGNEFRYPKTGYSAAITDFKGPRIVYQSIGDIYCDGVWDRDGTKKARNLKVNLGTTFNRNYFEIAFKYYPCKTDKDGLQYDNILSLDMGYRIFNVVMKKGAIHVELNNGKVDINTAIRCVDHKWQTLIFIYDNGILSVDTNKKYNVGKLNGSTNNFLSSMNFGNAHCFYGYLRELVVKTK